MRPEKQLLVDEIKEELDKRNSFMLMKYKGLTANLANKFRREISKTGGDVSIAKKRVLKLVMKNIGIEFAPDAFEEGHLGVVFMGKDPLSSAKMVFEFSKENGDSIEVIGGHLEGKTLSAKDIDALTKLPSKDVMRAQLIGTLEAPLSQTLAVMEAVLSSVIYCVDNKSKL